MQKPEYNFPQEKWKTRKGVWEEKRKSLDVVFYDATQTHDSFLINLPENVSKSEQEYSIKNDSVIIMSLQFHIKVLCHIRSTALYQDPQWHRQGKTKILN